MPAETTDHDHNERDVKRPKPQVTEQGLQGLENAVQTSVDPCVALQRFMAAPPAAINPRDILSLQRAAGNRAVQSLIARRKQMDTSSKPVFQRKRTINSPNDVHEQEADRVTDAVTRGGLSQVQRQDEDGGVETKRDEGVVAQALQKQGGQKGIQTTPLTQHQGSAEGFKMAEETPGRVNTARGGGQPLVSSLQVQMSKTMGHDFSDARVHTDQEADALSEQRQVKAFATSQDTFSQRSAYDRASSSNRELIACELTNRVEQSKNNIINPLQTIQRQDTGIAKGKAITRFTTAAKEIQTKWTTLSETQRANAFGALVNKELTKAMSYPCNIDATQDLGGSSGQFNFKTWTIQIDKVAMSAATVTTNQMAEVINTVYHEARHSEQWFRAARLQAGQNKTAAQIANEMGIWPAAAAEAVKRPLTPPGIISRIFRSKDYLKRQEKKIKEAETWFNSVYGTMAAHREATFQEVDTTGKAFDKAVADLNAKEAELQQANIDEAEATQEFRSANWLKLISLIPKMLRAISIKALKNFEYAALEMNYNIALTNAQEAHEKYKALPEEADAWAVGGAVESEYKNIP